MQNQILQQYIDLATPLIQSIKIQDQNLLNQEQAYQRLIQGQFQIPIFVTGEPQSGKSTFISALTNTFVLPMNKIANSSPPIGIINDFECNTPILYRTHLKMITLDLLIDNQLKSIISISDDNLQYVSQGDEQITSTLLSLNDSLEQIEKNIYIIKYNLGTAFNFENKNLLDQLIFLDNAMKFDFYRYHCINIQLFKTPTSLNNQDWIQYIQKIITMDHAQIQYLIGMNHIDQMDLDILGYTDNGKLEKFKFLENYFWKQLESSSTERGFAYSIQLVRMLQQFKIHFFNSQEELFQTNQQRNDSIKAAFFEEQKQANNLISNVQVQQQSEETNHTFREVKQSLEYQLTQSIQNQINILSLNLSKQRQLIPALNVKFQNLIGNLQNIIIRQEQMRDQTLQLANQIKNSIYVSQMNLTSIEMGNCILPFELIGKIDLNLQLLYMQIQEKCNIYIQMHNLRQSDYQTFITQTSIQNNFEQINTFSQYYTQLIQQFTQQKEKIIKELQTFQCFINEQRLNILLYSNQTQQDSKKYLVLTQGAAVIGQGYLGFKIAKNFQLKGLLGIGIFSLLGLFASFYHINKNQKSILVQIQPIMLQLNMQMENFKSQIENCFQDQISFQNSILKSQRNNLSILKQG